MKVIFIGLGSIGTRHLKNLGALCLKKSIDLHVTALRSSAAVLPNECAKLINREVHSLPKEDFDIAFITGPTHLHALAISGLKNRVNAFFIEKPIFEHPNYSLDEMGLGTKQKAYVAAPMRWTGVYSALKKQIPKHKIYSVRAICSSYLPNWRKGVDYRQNYSAHKSMGGGVSLDLIHEWDYLYSLFGAPEKTLNLRGKFSHLDINSDDLSIYIAQWNGFLAELHLDYFGREYCRKVQLFCENGCITANFGTGMLSLPNKEAQNFAENSNCLYEREMEYFLNYALHGQGESINSPQRALEVLKIALQAK